MKRKPDYGQATASIFGGLVSTLNGIYSAQAGLPITASGLTIGAVGLGYEAYKNLFEGLPDGKGYKVSALGFYVGAAECAWRGFSENNPGYFLVGAFLLSFGACFPHRWSSEANRYRKDFEREVRLRQLSGDEE